jgi:SNF family Na+-dependent transporter
LKFDYFILIILGVGIAMLLNSILGTLYYNVIIAWALFYFILSFRKTLLWSECGNWWNTDRCFVPGSTVDNNNIITNATVNCTLNELANFTLAECEPTKNTTRVTVTEEFY